jgi:hypothetical protein
MSEPFVWYRSDRTTPPADLVRPTVSRAMRNGFRRWLPEPDVRDRTMVLYGRRGFRKRRSWAGMFSEFHAVLGALVHAERHGAAAVRVDFRSELYVDPERGPNWWTYFFSDAELRLPGRVSRGDVHLTRRIAKYGRYGGFCDTINGATPYLYPMTFGVSLPELHRLLAAYVHVRPEIQEEVARIVAATFAPGAYVVGVHYRGTDSTGTLADGLVDLRTTPIPYTTYAAEVRAALEAASPREYQVMVATDEIEFVDFMRREFGDRVLCLDDVPRVRAGGLAIHFDSSLPVSNYQKGKSGLVDCLLLAATSYLVKGRSNLSDASLAFNPRLPYSFCVL